MNKGLCIVALSTLAIGGGCVEKQIDESFSQVQQNSQERLGEELLWNRDENAEVKIAERVSELLQEELTADAAVRIALINNRRLQATYSDVGSPRLSLLRHG